MKPIELIHKIQTFEPRAQKRVLKRNELLLPKNNCDTHIYFVESGTIRMFTEEGDAEQNIRFGYQGDIVVFMDAFFSGKPTAYSMQALKKTTLTVLTKAALQQFLEQDTIHLRIWLALLEDLVLQLLEREKDILTSTPTERYHRLLQRSPRLFQEISNRHIANYLRMSPETLSRLKKH